MIRTGLKRALIGPPLATSQLIHERISKLKGLAVFSSDALSSTAYATEEILIVLVTAGTAAVALALPVAIAISAVLAIVAFSYHQTIHAYPSGGGAYIVAHDNLGMWPGLAAAAALLIDYVLTVSVSVAAGIAAVTSAAPELFHMRVSLAVLAIAVVALINLRGVRESATIFAAPTYLFIGALGLTVIVGLWRTLGQAPLPPQVEPGPSLAPISLWLILRAYASVLARDGFLPRQLANLGDRLVFANGIVVLALLSGGLVYLFRASTHALIPLYALGVFLSFTLSQAGMVKRWWTHREPGWIRHMVINGIGATVTAIVLVVVVATKFLHGAWIVLVLIPVNIWMMYKIHRHYDEVRSQLTLEGAKIPDPIRRHKVVIPVGDLHRGVLPALRYAKSLSGEVVAVAVEIDPRRTQALKEKWERWGMGVPLRILSSPYRSVLGPLLRFLDGLEWETGFDQQITVVLPEFVPAKWWHFFLHGQTPLLLKLALYFRRRQGHRVTVVTDVPYYLSPAEQPVATGDAERVPARLSGSLAAVSTLFVTVGVLFGAALIRGWPQAVVAVLGLSLVVLLATLAFVLIIQSFLA